MSKVFNKLNILDVASGSNFMVKFDKAQNHCVIGLSEIRGRGSLTLIVNFSQYFLLARGFFLVPKCINLTKEVY